MNKSEEARFYVSARGCKGYALLLGPFATYEQARARARARVPEALTIAQSNQHVWEELLEAMEQCGGLSFGVVEVDAACATIGQA